MQKREREAAERAQAPATLITAVLVAEWAALEKVCRDRGWRLPEPAVRRATRSSYKPGTCSTARVETYDLPKDCALVRELVATPVERARIMRSEVPSSHTYKIGRKQPKVGWLTFEIKGLAALRATAALRPKVLGERALVSVGFNYEWLERNYSQYYREKATGTAEEVAEKLGDLHNVEVFQSRLVKGAHGYRAEKRVEELDEQRKKFEAERAKAPAHCKTYDQQRRWVRERRQGEKMLEEKAAERRGEKGRQRRCLPGTCRIIQLNCTSVSGGRASAKLAQIRQKLKEHDPDVVVLLETWLRAGVDDTPSFPGYEVHRVDRPGYKESAMGGHGGGIIMLVAGGVQWSPRQLQPPPPPGRKKQLLETAAVRIFPEKAPALDVCALYNTPNSARAQGKSTLMDLNLDGGWIPRRAVVCMDSNLHHRSWDPHCKESTINASQKTTRNMLEWVAKSGAKILNDGSVTFSCPTRGFRSAPDLTIATAAAGKAEWTRVEDWGTEHRAIVTEVVTGGTVRPPRKTAPKWRLKDADWPAYTEATERALRQAKGRTADELHKELAGAILQAAQAHIGLSAPKNMRKARCWWSKAAAEAVESRRAARKLAERTGQPQHIAAWRHAERLCKRVIGRGKRKSWRDFMTDLDANNNAGQQGRMEKVWRMKDSLAGQLKPRGRMKPLKEQEVSKDGSKREALLTRDVDKAEAFARGYAEVSRARRDAKEEQESDLTIRKDHQVGRAPPRRPAEDPAAAALCAPFVQSELQHVLRRLRPGRAAGVDTIPSEMLQHLGPRGERHLLRLANRSWARAEVPQPWRTAEIVPLPKGGKDHSIRKSYRPVSLTSAVSKAVERLIKNRVQDHLERRKLLAPEQAGYRTARSVEEHCVRLSQLIHDGRVRGDHTVLLSVDATAAFDRMVKAKLYAKMRAKGLPEQVVSWFR
eukprot:gene21375-17643_t